MAMNSVSVHELLYIMYSAPEFFEDTIAEEQYEAQKLDIMRDALRSKATYTIESKKMAEDEKNFKENASQSPIGSNGTQEDAQEDDSQA